MITQLSLVLLDLAYSQTRSSKALLHCPSSSDIYKILNSTTYEEKPNKHEPNTWYFCALHFSKKYYSYVSNCRADKYCPWEINNDKVMIGIYFVSEPVYTKKDIRFTLNLSRCPVPGEDPKGKIYYNSYNATVDRNDTNFNKIFLQEVGHSKRNHVIAKIVR